MRIRIAIGALVAVAALLGFVTVSNSSSKGAFPDKDSPEWRSQLDAMYENSARQESEFGPKMLLPEGPRQGWIKAYREMRDCYIAHDFTGAPEVADSFGDGKTGQPLIDTTKPNYDKAFLACPMALTPEISDAWQAAIPDASARSGLDRGVTITPDGERRVGNPEVQSDGSVVIEEK
jgi:hypothetical protein